MQSLHGINDSGFGATIRSSVWSSIVKETGFDRVLWMC